MASKALFYVCAIAVFCLATLCGAVNKPIPKYLHVCHKSDVHLTECMIKSIETLRPYLVRGIPELDIPSIDPINIGDLLVSESTQSNGIRITAKNIKSYGSGAFRIRNLEVIEYGQLYNVEVFFPEMRVEGTYDVSGQVLLLPIKGTGQFVGNFTDCIGNARLQFARKQVGDEAIAQIKKFTIKIKVGKGAIKLHNLFNGDQVLGEAINAVINQNFDVVSKDIIPLVEKALQRTLRRIATKITENFSYDEVFPL